MSALAMKKHRAGLIAIAAAMAISGLARGDGGHRYALDATYKEECGSCHIPYPPQLLTGQGWNSIMAGLDRHFGSDAGLEAARAREIGTYLTANAGRADRFSPADTPPRISGTAWFRYKHRDGHDGLRAAVWKSPAVKSPANCGACHTGAAAGNYREDDIRIPVIK